MKYTPKSYVYAKLLSVVFLLFVGCENILGTVKTNELVGAQAREHIGPATQAFDPGKYHKLYYISSGSGSDKTGDGSSQKPWQSIQHALSQISHADETKLHALLVSEGIYAGSTIQMREHVEFYGGFEQDTWQRDIFSNQTILDGEGERRVLLGADNAKIDGFVIKHGVVRGKGAGILCEGVSPNITNNIFFANKTLAPVSWQPQYWHEIANDGAALYCENGASPTIENNIFAKNSTEVGRGPAIALHGKCSPRVANNVFLHNTAGLKDSNRSSDGGAISVFDWSNPVIENNIILGNRAVTSNDGGGIFVALWSSPVISKNIFVDNACDDDAGALFVGGQEHRYDTPLDPLPTKDDFYVRITENVFIGNANPSQNSGAMRFTMESRGSFANNIVAYNDGIYFQRSEVTVVNNTILDNFLFVETKEGLRPGVIANNIIWGEFELETEAKVSHCNIRGGYDSEGNMSAAPLFVDDRVDIKAEAASYYPFKFITSFYISGSNFDKNMLANRIIKAGDKWSVVESNDAHNIMVWGDLSDEIEFSILPTYHLRADSPCIDKGTRENAPKKDIDNHIRPFGDRVDIGADEYNGK